MNKLAYPVCVIALLLVAPAQASYQVDPFSMKMASGEEITIFTYPQKNAVSISLKLMAPDGAGIFITALRNPDADTQVSVTLSQGRTYKLHRPPGKEIAVYSDQDNAAEKDRKFVTGCAAFFDKIESLRQAVAARVTANQSVNAEAVGGKLLEDAIAALKIFTSRQPG